MIIEAILPASLIVGLLFVVKYLGKNERYTIGGRSARLTINICSCTIAILNILITLFLPSIARYFQLEGLFDGDFVRVTINDIQEFSMGVVLLLIINISCLVVYKYKTKKVE